MKREEIERVFKEWQHRRPVPTANKLTIDRERMIWQRIRLGYSADDLCLIIRYMFESQDEDALWMRGEHRRKNTAHMDLANLLRIERLGGRIEAARLWEAGLATRASRSGAVDSVPFRFVPAPPPLERPDTALGDGPKNNPLPLPPSQTAISRFAIKVRRDDVAR